MSDKTKRKLITLLLEQVREKHEAVTAAKVSLASTSTSWECMAEFNGYTPPPDDEKARKGPIGYDESQHNKTVLAGERAVQSAQAELDEAYTELHEVLNS